MFGNTRQVALAVAEGLRVHGAVDLLSVNDAPARPDNELALLVVGGPTHVHGLSSRRSRQVTPAQTAQGATAGRIGLKEWLADLADAPRSLPVATFDTRFRKARWLTGSAAVNAARLLRRRGYPPAAPPESFFVAAGPGPLLPGELDRARRWGERLGATAATRPGTAP
jgi:hypothetical protein